MKNFIFSRDGQFSVYGGVLVAGDIDAYRIGIDMGTDTSGMAAVAVCQENGEYNGDYELSGNRIFVTLANSMYSTPGYITVRFAVSKGDSVITAKEIRFKVAPPNNSDTLAQNESGTLDTILTSVTRAEAAAQQVLSMIDNYALKSDTYTKEEIDSTVSSVYRYKGSVNQYSNLPENPSAGDVYNVKGAYKKTAYGLKILKTDIITIDADEFTSVPKCLLYFDDISAFENGDYIEMFDKDGVFAGSFTVQKETDGSKALCDTWNSLGLESIFAYLISKHKSTDINEMYYFTGISETSESIDLTSVNAGENVVWNGEEWDNLGGAVDLSSYSTTKQVSEMINSYVEEAILGGAW